MHVAIISARNLMQRLDQFVQQLTKLQLQGRGGVGNVVLEILAAEHGRAWLSQRVNFNAEWNGDSPIQNSGTKIVLSCDCPI